MATNLKTNTKPLTIVLIILILLNFFALRIFDSALKNEVSTQGIISYELAKDLDQSVNILNAWDPQAKINAGLSLGFDFLFLLVYSGLIALLIYNINNRLWQDKPFYKLGQVLIVLIFIAALFDAIENFALIKLLLGDLQQVWSSIAYYFAVVKFAIVFVCIAYLLVNWGVLMIKKK